MHLIPLVSVSGGFRLELKDAAKQFESCKTLAGFSNNWRIVFDGFLHWSNFGSEPGAAAYGQVYQSGALESVGGGFVYPLGNTRGPNVIGIGPLQTQLLEIVTFWTRYLDAASVPPPAQLFLTLNGAKGLPLARGGPFSMNTQPIDRATLTMSTHVESWNAETSTLLRPIFDQMWNAAGILSCPDYKSDGTYQPT